MATLTNEQKQKAINLEGLSEFKNKLDSLYKNEDGFEIIVNSDGSLTLKYEDGGI